MNKHVFIIRDGITIPVRIEAEESKTFLTRGQSSYKNKEQLLNLTALIWTLKALPIQTIDNLLGKKRARVKYKRKW